MDALTKSMLMNSCAPRYAAVQCWPSRVAKMLLPPTTQPWLGSTIWMADSRAGAGAVDTDGRQAAVSAANGVVAGGDGFADAEPHADSRAAPARLAIRALMLRAYGGP